MTPEKFENYISERRPVAPSTDYLKLGKVMIVSSNYLKVSWATKLFSKANTIMDQPFLTIVKADDPKVS
jgi:hypothetical protein